VAGEGTAGGDMAGRKVELGLIKNRVRSSGEDSR